MNPEVPTVPGWYWAKWDDSNRNDPERGWEVMWVGPGGGIQRAGVQEILDRNEMRRAVCRWVGPLELPK